MKKLFLIAMLCCAGAWSAQAVEGLEAGAGAGFVNLGNGDATWIAFATGELPLAVGLDDFGVNTSIVARLGTTGTSTRQLGAVTIDQSLDYFLSTFFKAGYEVAYDLKVYGMAGFSFGSATVKANNPLFQVAGNGTDSSMSWGLGADYRLNEQLIIGVDYTAYWSDVTSLAANVRFSF